jgi:hypothetical protein
VRASACLALEPEQQQCEHGRDDVEPAAHRIRHLAGAIPGRIAPDRHHRLVKRLIGQAVGSIAEQAGQ